MMDENLRISLRGATLRPWRENDAPALVRHANNPRVAAMMRDGFPHPYTREDAERFITLATGPSRNLLLAIEADGVAIGGIGIHLFEDVYRKSAEIGYWLGEDHQGRGIATEAVRALVPVAFERFEIIRLQAGVFSANKASMRVLEKCGFCKEAVHHNAIVKNGMVMDEVLYVRFP
jgi:RimJ/RimL family protein N-acetyltransferase